MTGLELATSHKQRQHSATELQRSGEHNSQKVKTKYNHIFQAKISGDIIELHNSCSVKGRNMQRIMQTLYTANILDVTACKQNL